MPPKAERPSKGKAKNQTSKKGLFDPKDHEEFSKWVRKYEVEISALEKTDQSSLHL